MGTIRRKGKVGRQIQHALAVGAAVGLALVLPGGDAPWAPTSGRVVYMAAVEMKGGTQQEKEPYPEAPLPAGAGYIKTPPNAAGRWVVSGDHRGAAR